MDLYHLIYQSQALAPFEPQELAALLHRGRTHNRAQGITGLLLHTDDGRFLQVLEGPKTAVRHLFYHVILSDTRHFHCHVISEGLCFRRNFSDWTMGCRVALPAEMRQLLGEAAPTDSLGLATRPYPRAQLLTLLQAFVSQGEEAAGQPHPLDSPATGPTR
jgi:hypothetical protein